MTDHDSILYLLNPQSNDGQALATWQKIRKSYSFLPEEPVDITTVNLAEVIAKQKPTLIVIAGGDGTINKVCREVVPLAKKPTLAIIPMGFGNALSYCLGVETVEKAISVIKEQQYSVTIDLMKTNLEGHEVGVFNIGIGFDARIVYNHQNFRYIGLRSYILSAMRSLLFHPEKKITLTIDHTVTMTAYASSLMIANCPILGQNYVVASDAKMDDGLLDCTLFSTKYAYITNIRLKGFKHPLYTELGKVHFKAKHILIAGEPLVQTDGDPVIHKEQVEISVIPTQVTFLRNDTKHIDQRYLPFII